MPRPTRPDTPNLPRISAKTILDLLSAPDYQPLKFDPLLDALNVPPADLELAERLLHDLEEQGLVVRLKHKGFALAEAADLVTGTISFMRSGAALLTARDSGREVFIPPGQTGTALPGDKVMARVSRQLDRGAGRASLEGVVIRVLERQRLTIVGTLKQMRRIYYVKPMQATLTHDIVVPETAGAKVGDRVLVRLTAWDEPNVSPEGEIVEVIGPADDPAFDTLSVCRAYQLPDSFPPEVIAQAERSTLTEADYAGRLDLRKKFIFTIDPATARDFDDAISLEKLPDGRWRLGVHIADVSHFVPVNSALDVEARRRATSVYFPDKVVPMLPEQLSNGLCSLKPEVDRLAFSAIILLDAEGRMRSATFAKTVIRSALRLTYEQAFAALQTPAGAAFPEAGMNKNAVAKLKQVHELAQRIRAHRFADGALQMDLPEVRFAIGPDGRIQDIVPVVNDASHQLIEECMLLANEAVCRELTHRGIPHLHRIHEAPDPERLAELEAQFLAFGWRVGSLTERANLTRLLEQLAERPEAQPLTTAVLRSMKRAMYSPELLGHYGLAKSHYDHFTSPIRRYPDLVVHRTLQAALTKTPFPYRKADLQELALHCSERENAAAEAERELIDQKRLRYFAEQLARGEVREFAAVVMEVRNFGLFIHLPQVMAYGLIHVSRLTDDFYDFNPVAQELRGRRCGTAYRLGMSLQVVVVKADLDKRQLDFQPVAAPQPARRPTRHYQQRQASSAAPPAGARPSRAETQAPRDKSKRGKGRRR